MRFSQLVGAAGWVREILFAVIALAAGLGLMPVLIFYTGATLLGRYEGAGLGALFRSIYAGLTTGSPASWVVLLGPYGLYLLARILAAWWRLGARPA